MISSYNTEQLDIRD